MEVVKVKIPNSTERSFLIKEQNGLVKISLTEEQQRLMDKFKKNGAGEVPIYSHDKPQTGSSYLASEEGVLIWVGDIGNKNKNVKKKVDYILNTETGKYTPVKQAEEVPSSEQGDPNAEVVKVEVEWAGYPKVTPLTSSVNGGKSKKRRTRRFKKKRKKKQTKKRKKKRRTKKRYKRRKKKSVRKRGKKKN